MDYGKIRYGKEKLLYCYMYLNKPERNMLTALEYLYSLKYKTLFFTKYDKKT